MEMEITKTKPYESQQPANTAAQSETKKEVISIVIYTKNYTVEIEID